MMLPVRPRLQKKAEASGASSSLRQQKNIIGYKKILTIQSVFQMRKNYFQINNNVFLIQIRQ